MYLDGKPNKEPDNVQYTYNVKLNQPLPDDLMHELGISMEDLTSLNQNGYMPLTKKAATALAKRRDLVASIALTPRLPWRHLSAERLHGMDTRQLWSGMDSAEGQDHNSQYEEHCRLRAPYTCV